MVVIGGSLRIGGDVDGDVVVVNGTLELLEDAKVRGEVRLADARITKNLGEVDGGIVKLLDDDRNLETEIRDRIRDELRGELRSELRSELRNVTRLGREDDGF